MGYYNKRSNTKKFTYGGTKTLSEVLDGIDSSGDDIRFGSVSDYPSVYYLGCNKRDISNIPMIIKAIKHLTNEQILPKRKKSRTRSKETS